MRKGVKKSPILELQAHPHRSAPSQPRSEPSLLVEHDEVGTLTDHDLFVTEFGNFADSDVAGCGAGSRLRARAPVVTNLSITTSLRGASIPPRAANILN